jgi:hypothetical protein
MPRSGTTLCEQILFSHSKVLVEVESYHILIRISELKSAYNINANKSDEFKKILIESEIDYFKKKLPYYLNIIKNI